ncbi:MAG TPA: hypothetical protein VHY30_00070 [Verrucomicrobiae bacterium]|jgi:hypothetical protein|nr:hypothetical protein [Verrucomicrobiae bacterium]
MTKKNWLMMIVLIALAGVYVFYFTDWFKPKIIHISHTSRAIRMRFRNNNAKTSTTVPITFSLEPQCKLTEIKVVLLAAWQTNQNVMPVWHLIADTNSTPIKIFVYGQRIRGLKPEVAGAHAEPLQPDVTYRLFVTAGKARGQHDFEVKAAN